MDTFLHDPRRVMVAAYNRLTHSHSGGPVREAEARLLAAAIAAYDMRSGELTDLHHVFRMALVIIGKHSDWVRSSERRRLSYRLERAHGPR
jgi:hypothetical protein